MKLEELEIAVLHCFASQQVNEEAPRTKILLAQPDCTTHIPRLHRMSVLRTLCFSLHVRRTVCTLFVRILFS